LAYSLNYNGEFSYMKSGYKTNMGYYFVRAVLAF
jgi:hypothetical protein